MMNNAYMQQLFSTVAYAAEQSPFYQKRISRDLVRSLSTPEDFAALPVTEKEDIALYTEHFLAVPEQEIVEITTTSGSTGSPLIVKMTESDMRRLARNEELSLSTAGLTHTDTVVLAVTLDKCFIAGLAYYSGLTRIGAASVRVGPISPEMLLQLAEQTRATAIIGVPSYLHRIADYADEKGVDIQKLPIEKLVCIGEPIRNDKLQLNPSGLRLQERWNSRLYSTYGITELQTSFCECDAGYGGHVYSEIVYIEVVDENNRPLPPGHIGEVVATPIGITGMPLIRFKTGDISFIIEEPCSCGRSGLRLGPVIGRKKQKLKIKGTSVYPQAFINILLEMEEVDEFAIIATSESSLSDSVEIIVSAKRNYAGLVEHVKSTIKGRTKVTPRITVSDKDSILQLIRNNSGRKTSRFIDRRR